MTARLLFIDLETSGLDPRHHEIFEIGAIVAEYAGGQWLERARLQLLHVTIRHPDECISAREVLAMHTDNGLLAELALERLRAHGNSFELLDDGQDRLLAWLKEQQLERPITAGFGVHFDRAFLAWHMPRFNDALHHRIIDVRTLVTLTEMTAPTSAAVILDDEPVVHRALPDCERAMRVLNRWHDWLAPTLVMVGRG